MTDGERRKLVFTNLCNGVSVPRVMEAMRLSEKEVMDDFKFVITKIRSYRFERSQPLIACGSVEDARTNRVQLLQTMIRCNLNTQAVYSRVETLPLENMPGGGMSDGELKMLEMRMKALEGQRR